MAGIAGDFDAQLAASRGFFADANLLLHRFQLENLIENPEAMPSPTLTQIVEAELNLAADQRARLLELGRKGVSCGEACVRLRPGEVVGYYYLALNLGIEALGRGVAGALFAGLAPRLRSAYEGGIKLDASFRGGAFYAIKGRYLSSSPWPLRDLDEAEAALKVACRSTPSSLHLLFAGDVHFRQGHLKEAVQSWRDAARAPRFPEIEAIHPMLVRLAELRVAAARK